MEDSARMGPNLPPDKGKEWLESSLPKSDNELEDFMGFPDEQMETDTDEQQSRKRRDKNTENNEKNNKQLKKEKQSRHKTEVNAKQHQTSTITNTKTNTNNSRTPTASKNETTENNSNNINQNNNNYQQHWVINDLHNIVFIEPISIKEGEKLLEPMEVGKFLHETKLDQFTELKRAGQYRYKLTYKRPKDTENILNATQTLNNNNYRAFIPKMLLETTGIITNIPTSITEREIFQNAISEKKIIRVERIKRRKDPKDARSGLIDTRSVKITVDGPQLPRTIQIYGVYAKPEVYIYPVRICTKCWRLGHKSLACKSKATCIKCGQHQTDDHTECQKTNRRKCRNCGGDHLPTSKDCPERIRMEHLNVAMTVNKMTYQEAEQLYPKPDISTKNRYALLESTVEFPEMEQPSTTNREFRQVNRTNKTNMDYKYIVQNLTNMNTPNQINKPKPVTQKNTYPTVEMIPEQVRTIENNPYKVTQTEKLQTEQKQNLTIQLQNIFSKITDKKTYNKPEIDLILIEIGTVIQNLLGDSKEQYKT